MDRPALAATGSEPPPSGAAPEESADRQPVGVGWRIALTVWVTGYGFLFAYEVLNTLFHALRR